MTQSDPNKVLRMLPVIMGGLGGTLLMINRFLTPNLLASQARSDVVGVILSAFLILTGLLWQQIQPRSPDTVKLIGESGFELLPELSEIVKTELAWASSLLLTNTVTKTIIIWYQGKILLRRGILPSESQVQPGAILKRVLDKQKPIYLVDLKVYPGRIEFNYLPENTQGVICQPIGNNGVMILGANAPRSYTKQDENWISGIAEKLTDTLSKKSGLFHS
ncbi:MAG: cofactor assembly of complex C subunit B [Cyanobacteria bacterium P01_H01_bin.35]